MIGNRLNGLLKTIQNTIAPISSIEEEEEDKSENSSSRLNNFEFNLSDSSEEDSNNNNENQTTSEINDNQLIQYYETIKKINELFPAAPNLVENPQLLSNTIEDLLDEIQSLSKQDESTRILYENHATLKSLKECLIQKEKEKDELTIKNRDLNDQLIQLGEEDDFVFDSIKQQYSDIKTEAITKQNHLEQQLTTNENIKAELASLQNQIDQSQNDDEVILKQLGDERRQYEQLLIQLSSYQASPQNVDPIALSSENELKHLEDEINQMQKETDMYVSQHNIDISNQKIRISELESQLQLLVDQYQNACDKKKKAQEQNHEEDTNKAENDEFRKNITSLLLKYYKGEKDALTQLKMIFNWTDDEMESMNSENQGISGIIKKSAVIFKAFKDSWTSWLIQAADSS